MAEVTTRSNSTYADPSTDLLGSGELSESLIPLGESIATMSDCAQALLGLIERVDRTRDTTTADRIWIHCSILASVAWRLNRELRSGRLS